MGCREEALPPSAQAHTPHISSGAPNTSFDLGEVVRRVHFAYQPEGNGWSAGHSTWSARVTVTGLTFTPRHALESSREPEHAPPGGSPRVLTVPPITFSAAEFSRGGVPVLPLAEGAEISPEGSLHLTRGEVEEQLLNSESGVEQRWSFTRAPSGQGVLRIRVPARGLPLVGQTSQGVHFADSTGLGVRYGNAAWTDASGNRTELPAQVVKGAVEFELPEPLLASSTFPAMLALVVSPEFGLDTPVTNPGGGRQTQPAIASNGTDYLVVWSDNRGSESPDLYGARVSSAGVVLDSLGIPISRKDNTQDNPTVAFDGTNYLVAWQDSRGGGSKNIYGARVTQAGAVLDPDGLPLNTSPFPETVMQSPSLVFDGTNYLLVWDERTLSNTPSNLYGVRISKAGARVGGQITLSSASGSQSAAALAFDGTNILAVWSDTRSGASADIYAARISKAGVVLDSAGIAVSTAAFDQVGPTVAFNGTSYFIAWTDYRDIPSTEQDIYGSRFTVSGSVLDPAGLGLVKRTSAQLSPCLAVVGNQLLLSWQDNTSSTTYRIQASRVDEAGTLLDPQGVTVAGAPGLKGWPTVGANNTGFFVAWHGAPDGDIQGARVAPSGDVLDPSSITVSLAPNSQMHPAVAFDGTNFLIVWEDNRGQSLDIYGVRVSANGTVLDPTGIAISTAPNHQRTPALAFDGTNYLVVWVDLRNEIWGDIYGARVSPGGTVLDPAGRVICARTDDQLGPAVVPDGTHSLVVWYDHFKGNNAIVGTRVSQAGEVLDPSFVEITSQARYQQPTLTFNGTSYLVAWINDRAPDIYSARVSPAGTVLDPSGILIAGGQANQDSPSVGSDGTNFLVAWRDASALLARRMSPAGTLLDATPITLTTTASGAPARTIAFDGTNFLVAWQDLRLNPNTDLYGGRVTPAGVALDGTGFVISAAPVNESQIALAAGGPRGVLAVYQVPDASLGPDIQRMRARWIGPPPNTPPVANGQSVTTREGQSVALVLSGSDAEGSALTYAIATPPTHGTLTGTAPDLIYTPALDYVGPDSFTFTVSDGQATSAQATVSLNVLPPNRAPVAIARELMVPAGIPSLVTLQGTDADGDPLTFSIVSPPVTGRLNGTPPDLVYTPPGSFHGTVRITFSVSDGLASSTATVQITAVPR